MPKPFAKALVAHLLASAMLAAPALAQAPAPAPSGPVADPLQSGFNNPPNAARPRVWWHWLNGNVTVDGIDKDLDWLARMGIGGVQNFDANLTTPQIVEKRLVYMDPAWKAAFRHAVATADAKGLEFAIAASPGWSETGGPWVTPADGMKKLVWSETVVPGGKPLRGKLASPPAITGPYQSVGFAGLFADPTVAGPKIPAMGGDIAILAVPAPAGVAPLPGEVRITDGTTRPAQALTDADEETALSVPVGTAEKPATVDLAYAGPLTAASARVFIKEARPPFAPPRYTARIEAQVGGAWQQVAQVPLAEAATTVSFAPVTASRFRLLIGPGPAFPAGGLGSVPGAVVSNLFPPSNPGEVHVGELRLFPEARVHQSETKAGFGTTPNYYEIDTVQATAGPLPDQVVDITGKLRLDGTLDWTPPKGTSWRILRFGWSLTGKVNHPATPEATGLEVDKYDAAAVERYMNGYLALYRDTVGAENIGAKGIRAILTDSIEVGASNWTPRLLEEFKARRGYDARPWLPALAGTVIGSAARSDQFLYDWRRTLGDLMADAHYGTVAKVAHANGLKVYGEALEDGRPVLGDDLDMRRNADVPMAALWTFPRGGNPRSGLLGDMKGAASVAHFYGQNIVAAESMTSAFSPWAFAPSDLKRVIDLEFAQGVNRPVVHTSVHQPNDEKLPGLSLAIFGQYFNRHETWADMAKPWIDYMASTSYLLQAGRSSADVAVFHGEESPTTVQFSQGTPKWLPQAHGYDLLSARMLAALKAEAGGELVSPGGARYRAVQLSPLTERMSLGALTDLKRLADAGARIVGRKPVASPGLNDDPAAFSALASAIWAMPNVVDEADVGAGLKRLGIAPDFEVLEGPAADLRFVHRKLVDGDLYFVNNRQSAAVSARIRFGVTGRVPEVWRAIGGTVERVSYQSDAAGTVVPLDLGPEDALFVVFRQPATATSATVAPAVWQEVAALPAAWSVAFQPRRGAPPVIKLGALSGLETNADPAVRHFSGTASYTTTFARPAAKGPLWLDLGKVGDVAEVLVNGKSAGISWFPPYRFEVGSLLKRGRNTIEVRVANLWVNRLVGDQQPGAKPITWTAVPTYHPDAPLRPAGLIGPVRLLTRK